MHRRRVRSKLARPDRTTLSEAIDEARSTDPRRARRRRRVLHSRLCADRRPGDQVPPGHHAAAQGWHMGILGGMAKGTRPYDKDVAARSAMFVDQLMLMHNEGFIPGIRERRADEGEARDLGAEGQVRQVRAGREGRDGEARFSGWERSRRVARGDRAGGSLVQQLPRRLPEQGPVQQLADEGPAQPALALPPRSRRNSRFSAYQTASPHSASSTIAFTVGRRRILCIRAAPCGSCLYPVTIGTIRLSFSSAR